MRKDRPQTTAVRVTYHTIDVDGLSLFYREAGANVASYPAWQRFLRERRPPTLVLRGRYDPSFALEGAHAYRDDIPDAEIHILDAGHFALDEATDEIASLTRAFLANHVGV